MTHITLAHGNGGHYMRQLIEEVLPEDLEITIKDGITTEMIATMKINKAILIFILP